MIIGLSLYLLFIIIGAAALCTDMKKGQSIEEYFQSEFRKEDSGRAPLYIMILIPGLNVIAVLCLMVILIYNLIKNFRK